MHNNDFLGDMRIISLYGHSNCGKSETLNELKELLRATGKSISLVEHSNCDIPETFDYKGLIVSVAPGGDTRAVVEENCRYFKMNRCDIAITATRTKWGSVDALKEFAEKEGIEIEWIAKSYEYNLSRATHLRCNKETAEVLFKML